MVACADSGDPVRRRGTAPDSRLVVGAGPAPTKAEPAPDAQAILPDVTRRLSPRNVTRTETHNEANPRFSLDGRYLAFERRAGSAQAIFVTGIRDDGELYQRISSLPEPTLASTEQSLVGGHGVDDSFNMQLAFLPDGSSVVFTGNAGTGAYRLYLARLGGDPDLETLTQRSTEDGHPAVSPDGRWLAYVSARAGVGKLFLRDLGSDVERQLTQGADVDLHPVWSPDSKSIAFTSGANDNHDVFLIPEVLAPEAAPVPLTLWSFDDLRPTFSPDGTQIAFYSNFSPRGEDGEWSILVVPADGSGPTKGMALADHVVATNVVKDSAVGPAWLARGRALVFARNLKEEWNPIYVVDVASGQERRIETDTRMNHDLTCSSQGLLAFRAQVGSWDDIFIAPVLRMP
jgi:TolB protein